MDAADMASYGLEYTGVKRAFWRRYSPVVRAACSLGVLRSAAGLVIDTQQEGSASFNAMNYLDFTQYDVAVKAYETFLSYTETARWVFFIAYRAPAVYAHFIFTSLVRPRASLLPVKRDACTLREAAEIVAEETAQMAQQIQIARERIAGTQSGQTQDKSTASVGSTKAKKGRGRAIAEEDQQEAVLDPNRFGPSGDWEAVDQTCISKTDSGDSYSYELCLFGKFKQGSTLIGRYDNWINDKGADRDLFGSLKQTLITNRASAELQYGRYMRYTNGDYCYAAKRNRYANIRFVCAETISILRVQEFEVMTTSYNNEHDVFFLSV